MDGALASEAKEDTAEDQNSSQVSVRIAVTNSVFMEDSEKNRYIEFLILQKEERDRTIADKDAFIKNLQDTLDMLKSMHESDSKKIDEMLTKINDLTARLNKKQ